MISLLFEVVLRMSMQALLCIARSCDSYCNKAYPPTAFDHIISHCKSCWLCRLLQEYQAKSKYNWNNYSNSTVLMHLPKVPYFSRMESKVACLLLIKRTYYEYDATSVYMMVPMSRRYASKFLVLSTMQKCHTRYVRKYD